MEFDLQTFLQDMEKRAEDREKRAEDRHKRLEDKIDTCLLTVADHETRVTVIEETPIKEHEHRLIKVEGFVKNARWLIGTVIVGGITALFGYVTTYFTKP